MRLGELGERQAISLLTSIIAPVNRAEIGAGEDDCAVINVDGTCLVLTTDTVHQSADFPAGSTYYEMGWKGVGVNLSDIASMGAVPLFFVASVGVPSDMEISGFRELFEGMRDCCRTFSTSFVGGDLDEFDEVVITGTALGRVVADTPLLRKVARPGDLICVTGVIGRGHVSLLRNDTRTLNMLVPRVHEGIAIGKSGVATAMTDISDSLAISLHDICESSGVGARVDFERIPVYEPVHDLNNPFEAVFYGGDDYELLFTISPEKEAHLEGVEYSIIGEVVRDAGVVVQRGGERILLERRGYQHLNAL